MGQIIHVAMMATRCGHDGNTLSLRISEGRAGQQARKLLGRSWGHEFGMHMTGMQGISCEYWERGSKGDLHNIRLWQGRGKHRRVISDRDQTFVGTLKQHH